METSLRATEIRLRPTRVLPSVVALPVPDVTDTFQTSLLLTPVSNTLLLLLGRHVAPLTVEDSLEAASELLAPLRATEVVRPFPLSGVVGGAGVVVDTTAVLSAL